MKARKKEMITEGVLKKSKRSSRMYLIFSLEFFDRLDPDSTAETSVFEKDEKEIRDFVLSAEMRGFLFSRL